MRAISTLIPQAYSAHLKAIDSGSPINFSSSREEGAISPVSMLRMFQLDKSTPVAQAEESKQPRKVLQSGISENTENKAQSTPDLNNDFRSTQNGSSGPAPLPKVQEGEGVQDTEQTDPPEDGESVQPITSSPEASYDDLEFDTDSETVASGFKQLDNTVTYVTTTTTEVEERKVTDVQKAEEFSTVSESTAQPRKVVSITSSRTSSGPQRYEVQSTIQGGVQRKTSFYQPTRFPSAIEAGLSSNVSSASNAVEPWRSMASKSALEELLEIKLLHQEEKRLREEEKRLQEEEEKRTLNILSLAAAERKDYERWVEQQFKASRTENERVVGELLLKIQPNSRGDSHPRTALQCGKVDSTITTTIATITTTIISVTTRIEQWKRTVARNNVLTTITNTELEQLLLDLSTASSQMTSLQQNYAELSGDFRVTLSLRDEKDHTIATLTAELIQWKNADAGKALQITAVRQDNEMLRRDLSAASSRTAELQQRHDTQSRELGSTRKELQTTVSLIEERDRTIASLAAEVAHWKQSDVTKAEQIATARRDFEEVRRDLSASSSQIAELQKRHDAQSEELGSVRSELQANKSLVEQKDRTITTLTAEVDQWKRVDATKAEQFAAEHQDKEKLQRDLAAFSSQTADLQKRYDVQSKDIATIRNELQTKMSLLEEKEHAINSLTTDIAQAKREDSAKAEQISAARRDLEQLRRELSSASDRFADVQERYAAQSQELNSVRDELRQIEFQVSGKPSKSGVSQHIARALEEKNKQMEELRCNFTTATSRNTELQRSYEALSSEASALRDQLSVQASQHEGTIASLSTQVDQWKRVDATKAEQIMTTLKQSEKLQQDLSVSISQLAGLQSRYEAQSSEFIALRNELQVSTSSGEGKDRTIASLTVEVDQWKRADANKSEQISATLKRVEDLQRDLSTSSSQLAELQGRYAAQSRELINVRNELQTNTSLYEGKDQTIGSLTAELGQWKRADATKGERIATAIKEIEKLRRDLSTSTSQLAELQGRYEAQSHELVSVRNDLQSRTSTNEDKDRTVAALTAQVEEGKRTDVLKEKHIVAIRKQAEDLQRELTNTSSQISELRQRYEVQSSELSSFRDKVSDKDRYVSTLISQVEEWKGSDASKTEELTIVRKDIEQLRRDLVTSSSQLESWKHSDATRLEELTVAQKDLEWLRRDLSISSSQIAENQQRYTAQSAELTSQIEQWKRSNAAKEGELTTTRKELERLQNDFSTSSSRLIELQQRYEAQSTELKSLHKLLQATPPSGDGDATVATLKAQIDQWKRVDAAKTEELEQLQRKLTASSSQLVSLAKSTSISEETKKVYETITTKEVKDHSAVIKLTTTVDQWLRADAKRAEELASELENRKKENEELRDNLVTLKEIYIRAPELKQIFQSETIEIQRRSEELKFALAERQSQLDVVQRFVTTADKYADDMIIQVLRRLNAEVQQNTTFMADCILQDFQPRTAQLAKEQRSAVQRVSESIGRPLAACLERKNRDDVALYLQIIFQAYLTYYLHSILSSWTIKRERSEFINEIYERLQKSEAQTISGRWRSLTRTYISPTSIGNPDSLISDIVAGLSNIVVAAGCAASLSAARSKVSSQFKEKVTSIISIAGQFSKMIGEVVAADFEVLVVRPAQIFEETKMEEDDVDDYEKSQGVSRGTATGQKVLCSTQLGMTKRMQLESGNKDRLTVIKAKVVLESFLDG
ncbi:hypothetical protein OG21DRAFT_1486320 [Imleria badia]|nr:hypothetical protein OG21DRAFT_1486320 [Imleria badia]